MNSSLHDIQADIQRLTKQQNQMQASEMLNEQQKQHPLNSHKHPHMQPVHQPHPQHYPVQQQPYYNNMQSFMPVSHVPQGIQFSQISAKPPQVDQTQFYLHDQSQTQRRTWDLPTDVGGPAYQHPEIVRSKKPQQGFMLHDPNDSHEVRYQNGEHTMHHHTPGRSLSQQHAEHLQNQSLHYSEPSTPHKALPQHRNIHKQISQLMDSEKTSFVNLSQFSDAYDKPRNNSVTHAPIPTPPVDDMEPQNISFIGNSEDNYVQGNF